jgi:hypothetical protein
LHITGINLVLKPGEKIVQAWRATGWWPDDYSIAIFDMEKSRHRALSRSLGSLLDGLQSNSAFWNGLACAGVLRWNV